MNYSFVNLTVLEKELKNAVGDLLVDGKESLETPIGHTKQVDTQEVANRLGDVLGIEANFLDFCWEMNSLYDWSKAWLEIGLTKIYVTKGKSLKTIIDEILAAVRDEIAGKEKEFMYASVNAEGFETMYLHKENLLEEIPIHDLVQYLNEDRYCDDKFVTWLESIGYVIKDGVHPEFGEVSKYVDISQVVEGAKIWLVEGSKQHTLYRSAGPRCRLEVMYLLHALANGEALFSDEY